jgi:hypothetical protein
MIPDDFQALAEKTLAEARAKTPTNASHSLAMIGCGYAILALVAQRASQPDARVRAAANEALARAQWGPA